MDQRSPIRVLLVEDHPMTRAGLSYFLKAFPDLELIGAVASGEEAIDLCGRAEPDVILMDMKLPGIDGIATTRTIKQHLPAVQVIALSSFTKAKEILGTHGVRFES